MGSLIKATFLQDRNAFSGGTRADNATEPLMRNELSEIFGDELDHATSYLARRQTGARSDRGALIAA